MSSENGRSNSFLLEPMTPDDLEDVLAIETAAFPSPWSRNLFLEEFSSSVARNLTIRISSRGRSILVGYAVFRIAADEVDIQRIAVKPEFRRRRAATFLMKALLQKAGKEGCTQAFLEVRPSNEAAIRLYEKLGFVVKGIRKSYYVEQGEDALVMGRDIPAGSGSSEL